MNIQPFFRIYYKNENWWAIDSSKLSIGLMIVQNIISKALETIHIELLLDQNKANFIFFQKL
jgi:hypothetical protein